MNGFPLQAHPKYLSCIATCCFYIAAKTQEDDVFIPNATELVKLSQCGGTVSDLVRMEKLILDKLSWELNAVTPLTFLHLFYEVFAARDARMADQAIFNAIVGKLEVIMCQFEFTQYRVSKLKETYYFQLIKFSVSLKIIFMNIAGVYFHSVRIL